VTVPASVKFDPTPVLRRLIGWSDHDIAERCAVSATAVAKWRHGGQLRASTADRVATRLDLHPSLLWPDEWWTP
jgi:transcriptional regulator with XRE-family HTH domain